MKHRVSSYRHYFSNSNSGNTSTPESKRYPDSTLSLLYARFQGLPILPVPVLVNNYAYLIADLSEHIFVLVDVGDANYRWNGRFDKNQPQEDSPDKDVSRQFAIRPEDINQNEEDKMQRQNIVIFKSKNAIHAYYVALMGTLQPIFREHSPPWR
ncbi:hypothetical protein RRG08_062163 [Elysia crispata]|uniref:Uncharacterized protein n=1 Tax=Elysia crispata TaxID=231223 RepID=A0AAE0YBL8_9GAST|nr:hypothetical protein RRG08_062163 [Elysia crispata]